MSIIFDHRSSLDWHWLIMLTTTVAKLVKILPSRAQAPRVWAHLGWFRCNDFDAIVSNLQGVSNICQKELGPSFYTPLDWWVGTRAPPFHKNLVYVMVGYRYICIEWILFWAYILWNTTIVLPSRPDMQRNASPVCYGNGKKMNSWNQENLTCILWNWLLFEGVSLRYLKIF